MVTSMQFVPPAAPWRMRMALSLSVLLHVLLLSIPIQGDVFGLSGLRLPWQERRLAASDLQIVLTPAPTAAPPAPAVAPRPLPLPATEPAPAPRERPAAAPPGRAEPKPNPKPDLKPEPDRQAAEQSRQVELIALARERADREASARVELDRIAAERREAARQEQDRRDALARLEEEHAAAARLEAERLELERLDAVRREQETARLEAARLEAARQEAIQQEQARQEQARLEEAQREQERARQAQVQAQASQAPVQQGPVDRGQAAQLAPRAEQLRAIAEQLARESAGRDRAGTAPGVPPPTVSGLRRGWLFGRSDPNQDMVQYAQAMGRKIELNRTLDMVREAVKQPHTQPVVTVAVRADGSVEKITFETSSGVAAIDDGIRKIIASQAPYGPFPPALARQYDVVEIRRTWLFDVAVRLQ
ncbi:TonB C-terminal domain-containing protein [Massilia arenae]|uniref:TonB family protein n=1 Tax=Massilia arenae TaxID=2603288 RepID=A0A5C7G5M1_9BURK|nr:TonB C-terminal domain-containing protein [Massilia arenae]TXG00191.1 hypothetical protein FVD38_09220 [Massilia arenae]